MKKLWHSRTVPPIANYKRVIGFDGLHSVHTTKGTAIRVLYVVPNLCGQANLDGALPAAMLAGTGVIVTRSVANGAWKPLGAQTT